MSYRNFVEHLVSSVVENPQSVEIEEDVEAGNRTFYVHVAPEDVGKVIGKSGRVVSAIRCVVSAVAAKSREKAFVKVVTPD
ncbi:MAG TPA: KH domain-containing protein [Fimbriimonadaceae bacterium]|nr:KH domain-containing protein [Fimbriimonadaceae bacterium]